MSVRRLLAVLLLALAALSARAGEPELPVYFFWSLTCPHCTTARPHVQAMAQERPRVRLHELELSRHPEHVRQYETMARELGEEANSVPALVFCGEMHVGWDSDETTGRLLRQPA